MHDVLLDVHVSLPKRKQENQENNLVQNLQQRITIDAPQIFVPTKFIGVYKAFLMKINQYKHYEYCDYSLRYDPKKNKIFRKLYEFHIDLMRNTHKIVIIHGVERNEMTNMWEI